MYSYKIKIRCRPYHGTTKEEAGPEYREFVVHEDMASDFDKAYHAAKLIVQGAQSSGKLWNVHIVSIVQMKEQDDI